MYSIFVTINIEPDRVGEFREASLGDAQGSVRDEPGCYRFDIHQDAAVATRFYLVEVYQDKQAFEAHLETPHFKKWISTVEEMFTEEIHKIEMSTVFPSPAGWQAQKPGLMDW